MKPLLKAIREELEETHDTEQALMKLLKLLEREQQLEESMWREHLDKPRMKGKPE